MPRAGGSPRELARLPHAALAMTFGSDGALHLTLNTPVAPEAWRLTLDGTLAREAPAPYSVVLPAPAGGWTVAGMDQEMRQSLELIPPGGRLGAPTNQRLPLKPWVWDWSGRTLIASSETQMVRVGVDGTQRPLFTFDDAMFGVAVAPDGETVYGSMSVAHVRRELVVNYGKRPRPR
jgi:hypothetical protein